MKNTVRATRNGVTKPVPVQTKTARAEKPTAPNVRIVIKDEAGKDFADFEIHPAFYAAMQRDAKAKGISLMQWMETAVRAKIETEAAAQKEKAAQAEWDTRIAAEFAPPDDDNYHGACVAIYDREGKGVVSKIPLTEKEFTDACVKHFGDNGLENFIAQAIREKTKRDAAQAKIETEAAAAPAGANDKVTLLFFSQKEDASLAHVELTAAQFSTIQSQVKKSGLSLETFLNR
jgi:hypothetical protein